MALNAIDMMPKKEYLVGITIIEGREIYGKDLAGTSDPFVKIRCADQIQQSTKKYEQNSAVWNQSLTFTGLLMNDFELETFELIIELYDHNAIFQNELIGVYSIGLSSLHRSLNHEFYRQWVGVFNPEDPNVVQGYLMISCFIVGPGERPPVHGPDEEMGNDDGVISDEDEEEFLKRMENLKRSKGVTVVAQPDLIEKNFQLNVSISKAENLYIQEGEVVNPFVSCRVNGCHLISRKQTKNQNPQFLSKLCYPITYPILNDKITMRLWSWETGLTPNRLLATIPEHPSAIDYFNISKLLSMDSRFSKWFNLYGPRPHERGPRTKGLRDGSAYLGRVLLSFSIIPCEVPTLCVQNMQSSTKEPKQSDFQLWVDFYELIQFEQAATPDHNVWLQVSQGDKKCEDYIEGRYKQKTNSWDFPKHKQLDALITEFPEDYNQIADIFIDFYCNKGSEPKERVGYIRLKAKDVASKKPAPQWRRIRSPYNDVNPATLGQIMMNVQFLRYDRMNNTGPERIFIDRGKRQSYTFFYQILSGLEIADAFSNQKLNTRVEISIGNLVGDKSIKTKYSPGRYPQWMEMNHKEVFLQKNLAFQTDMKVSIQNENPSDKKIGYNVIGEFCVVITSLQAHCNQPQFFNVLTPDGKLVGQILANFYIKHFEKKNDQRNNPALNEIAKIQENFEHVIMSPKPCETDFRIDFSLLGIRNLTQKMKNPIVTLWLSNNPSDRKVFIVNKDVELGRRKKDDGDDEQKKKELGQDALKKKGDGLLQKWSDQLSSQLGFNQQIEELKQVEYYYKYGFFTRNQNIDLFEMTENPTFGQKITFTDVRLFNEPLLWPLLVVEIRDLDSRGINLFGKKGNDMFTTIPLFKYAVDYLLDDREKKYADAQFSRNQTQLSYIQTQIEPTQFMKDVGVWDEFDEWQAEKEDDEADQADGAVGGDTLKGGTKRRNKGGRRQNDNNAYQRGTIDQNLKMRGTFRPTVNNGFEMMKVGDPNQNAVNEMNAQIQRQTKGGKKDFQDLHSLLKSIGKLDHYINNEDKMFLIGRLTQGGQMDAGLDLNFGDDSDSGDDGAIDLQAGDVIAQDKDYENFGILIGESENIKVGKVNKEEEKQQREKRIAELKDEKAKYQRKINSFNDPQKLTNDDLNRKRLMQMHMLELTEEIDDLLDEEMTTERFWGAAGLDFDEVMFDYGRDIKKDENLDEELKKKFLPYKVFNLFQQDNDQNYPGKESQIYYDQGFMRSGKISGAFLKADVCIYEGESESEFDSDIEDSDEENSGDEANHKDIQLKLQPSQKEKEQKLNENLEHHEKVLQRQLEIYHEYKNDIIDEPFLNRIIDTYKEYSFKVRVYLLSGQNLSAMSNSIDLKSYLAGMVAMCTANPFPLLTIGDGQNNDQLKLLKRTGSKEQAIMNELNPEFLCMYELDARLPEDWKLKIEIMDKQAVGVKLIGATEIDLENRRHSDLLFLNKEAIKIELEKLDEKRKKFNVFKNKRCKGLPANDLLRKKLDKLDQRMKAERIDMNQLTRELKQVEQVYAPIEFRELYHPQKNQAQGILEMFVETFTEEDSRKIDRSKMKPVSKQTYEIRLVIWETREIPLIDQNQVDITVRVTFDPTGDPEDEVIKNTDVHMASKDGIGIFNWRMKFKLQTPCNFPRLKFQVFDSNVTGDIAIGEASISVKRAMKTLIKEESLKMPKSFIQLVNPEHKEDHQGLLMFSMDIMLIDDANQDPVGEAQEEPNKDPFLKKPTAGRGLGDAMSSVGLIPNIDVSWNPFGKLLYVIIFFGVMGTILTFAVVLK